MINEMYLNYEPSDDTPDQVFQDCYELEIYIYETQKVPKMAFVSDSYLSHRAKSKQGFSQASMAYEHHSGYVVRLVKWPKHINTPLWKVLNEDV